MRQLRQTWKGLLLTLLATSGILIACQKDARTPSVTSASSECCVSDYSKTPTTLFECGDAASGYLTIVGQNNANSITFTINRTGLLNKNTQNRFTKVDFTIKDKDGVTVATGGTKGSETAPKTSFSFTYTLDEGMSFEGCEAFTVDLVIVGLEGFNALPINCQNKFNNMGQGKFGTTFSYIVKTICPDTEQPCTPRTQTQGYYGSNRKGTGSFGWKFLNSNFTSPITIGDAGCGRSREFTTAVQINDFIAKNNAKGTVYLLPKESTFASQVLALSLNVRFFPGLGEMIVIKEGTFFGMSVNQVLHLGNQAIAGCEGVLNFTNPVTELEYTLTPSQINNIVDAINNSYTDGKDQGTGVIDCP